MDPTEKIKELESKMTTLEASLTLKEQEIENLKAEILKLKGEMQALTTENDRIIAEKKETDKELTITKANAQEEKDQAAAEKIVSDIMASATVSETFHDKIRGQFVDRKTGKLNTGGYKDAQGIFDTVAFETAFKAEVVDWEGKIVASSGPGPSKPKDELEADASLYSSENESLLAPYKKENK